MIESPRPDFSALMARRDNLRAERAQATQLVQDGIFQNKIDAGVELWLVRVNKEIAEIDWMLNHFSHEEPKTKSSLTHGTVVVIALIFMAIYLAIGASVLMLQR